MHHFMWFPADCSASYKHEQVEASVNASSRRVVFFPLLSQRCEIKDCREQPASDVFIFMSSFLANLLFSSQDGVECELLMSLHSVSHCAEESGSKVAEKLRHIV